VNLHDEMEWIVTGFEVAGVAILVVGSLVAFGSAAATARHGGRRAAYKRARQDVGRAILLGLEVLIIADIVLTITVDRTLDSAITLGVIVLVRTFLSFSLEIELEGTLPWRRNPAGREVTAAADPPPAEEPEQLPADRI
jgi:uncharacterized membrane protein